MQDPRKSRNEKTCLQNYKRISVLDVVGVEGLGVARGQVGAQQCGSLDVVGVEELGVTRWSGCEDTVLVVWM